MGCVQRTRAPAHHHHHAPTPALRLSAGRVPFAFLTNGGGVLEEKKAAAFSEKFGIPVATEQVCTRFWRGGGARGWWRRARGAEDCRAQRAPLPHLTLPSRSIGCQVILSHTPMKALVPKYK